MTDNLRAFESGAVRSADADSARYDLVSHVGMRRLAETYADGAAKYGDHNWLKGIPASNLLNHAIAHIFKFLSGDTSEDHLSHAAWGLFATMHFQETRPDLMDVPHTPAKMDPKLGIDPPTPVDKVVFQKVLVDWNKTAVTASEAPEIEGRIRV